MEPLSIDTDYQRLQRSDSTFSPVSPQNSVADQSMISSIYASKAYNQSAQRKTPGGRRQLNRFNAFVTCGAEEFIIAGDSLKHSENFVPPEEAETIGNTPATVNLQEEESPGIENESDKHFINVKSNN